MRKYLIIGLLITIQNLISCSEQTKNRVESTISSNSKDLVIKNISVVTMKSDTVINSQDVVIKNGKISAISSTHKKEYHGLMVIDGSGKYIMPSLSDAHVHLPKIEKEMEINMRFHLINGVTKLRSMRGDWNHSSLKGKYNNASSIYPKLYLSPPVIGGNSDLSVSQAEEFVKSAKEKGFDFIKILGVKNQKIFNNIDFAAKKYGLAIAGHFPSNVHDSIIFNSNYTSFEHLGGLAGVPDFLEERLNNVKEKNITLCPTLSWYSIGSGRYSYEELRRLPGIEFIRESTVDDWIDKTTKYRKKIGNEAYVTEVANELKYLDEKYAIIKKAHDLGINMLLSPDSSSKYIVPGFSVLGEMELLKNANLTNFEILKMATINFAEFFKEDYGIIEAGRNADFIVLDKNPLKDLSSLNNIEGLYFNNQFLDSEQLTAIRTELLETAHN